MKSYSDKNYYKSFYSDANNQFDAIETTIAHLFGYPTTTLNELPYSSFWAENIELINKSYIGTNIVKMLIADINKVKKHNI